MSAWGEVAVAVLGTGAVTTAINGWLNRRKTAAEGRRVEAETEMTLSGGYQQLLAELYKDRDDLKRELRQSHEDNLKLREQIVGLRDDFAAVKRDLRRVLQGEQPLTDWLN